MNHLRTVRLAMLAGTVLATAIVVAACGSSSNTSSGAASAGGNANAASSGPNSGTRTKFVACLKAHGVTLPHRPTGQGPYGGGQGGSPPPGGGQGGSPPYGGGGAFFFGGGHRRPGSARFDNPKMRAALQACGGRRFSPRRFTPNKAAVTKFVACVKQHGYHLPTPNFSGKGPIFPGTIERNKKFQTAAQACASDLRPSGAPGSASGGGGSSGSSD